MARGRGRKYQRLKAAAEAKEALRKYEPFLVQSRNFEWVPLAAISCEQALHLHTLTVPILIYKLSP